MADYRPTPTDIALAAATEKASKFADLKARQAESDRQNAEHRAKLAKPVQVTRIGPAWSDGRPKGR